MLPSSSSISEVSNCLESRDGDPPPSLRNYFNRHNPSTPNECLNIIIHVNMLEVGFILSGISESNLSLPSCWKELVSTFKYIHPGFQNFECTIVSVTMGNVKQVLASFSGQESELMIKLNINDYFPSGVELEKIIKLSQLSRILRNNLLYPLQIAAHEKLGVPAPWHIAGLPSEILIKIMSLLKLKDVLTLSLCCKRLNNCTLNNKLWYNLFKQNFKEHFHSSDTISGTDWRSKYKAAYLKKKSAERIDAEMQSNVTNPYQNLQHPRPYFPDNPFSPFNPGSEPYYPHPNPYLDPDSPYFGGEIPFPRPRNPFGIGPSPRNPMSPLQPPYMPFGYRPSRGPRFDFI